MKAINIKQLIHPILVREGAGVKLHRYIGADRNHPFEPILLFDYFDSDDAMDYIAGFPAHPHRGFETVTYLFKGMIKHEDNQGHEGLIKAGDVQWMTAGSGIVHSEMPLQSKEGLKGLQLWLNLPAANKWDKPRYQELSASEFPIEEMGSHSKIKVIAGETDKGTSGPVTDIVTAPLFLDLQLGAKSVFQQHIPKGYQAILFVIDGALQVENQELGQQMMAALTEGEILKISTGDFPCQCLLIAARQLNEPITRLGPFVMNTEEELRQAVEDFRQQKF